MERDFRELVALNNELKRFVCVGLDPQMEVTSDLRINADSMFDRLVRFVSPIIDATADVAGMYKPNLWFYLQYGPEGLAALEEICARIHDVAPTAILTLDLKGGDIGDTNGRALKLVRERCNADAATIHNYMGMVGMSPYLDDPTFGSFALVRTSNPGADEFQRRKVLLTQAEIDAGMGVSDHADMFEVVAHAVATDWNTRGNVGAVAGASPDSIEDLAAVRAALSSGVPVLCPGVGKQGGSASIAFVAGSDGDRENIWINQSSDITHAHRKPEYAGMNWGEAAAAQANQTNAEILAAVTA